MTSTAENISEPQVDFRILESNPSKIAVLTLMNSVPILQTITYECNLPKASELNSNDSALKLLLKKYVNSLPANWQMLYENDGYSVFNATKDAHLEGILAVKSEIKPDPPSTLVNKLRDAEVFLFMATPEIYLNEIFPRLADTPPCKWVQNILDGTKEAERVHFKKDNEFLIVEGGNYDAKTMARSEARFLVLFHDENLKSIRDLDASHIGMLERVKEAINTLNSVDGVVQNDLKAYFHYFPSFLLLHIHVSHVTMGFGVNMGRARGLNDVLSMLKIHQKPFKDLSLHITSTTANFPHNKVLDKLMS